MVTLDESPSEQRTWAMLDERKIAWFVTIHPEGKPHVVPVWFLWRNGSALVLSQPGAQKVRNLRQNPHCSLAIDDSREGHDPVAFEGVATLASETISPADLDAYIAKYGAMLSEMSWTPAQMIGEYSQLIRVAPATFLKVS